MRGEHRGPCRAHLPQLFQPPLVAFAPRGNPAFEPVRLEFQPGIHTFCGAGFFGIDRVFPGLITAKANLFAAHRSAINPQRCAGQPGEECSVMADDDEGASEARKPAFEPFNRRQIKVVGRLVEQQQIGFGGQRARQSRTTPFAAAGAF